MKKEKALKSRAFAWLLSLAIVLSMAPVTAFAAEAADPAATAAEPRSSAVTFLNSGYPYGKAMGSSSITLVIEVDGTAGSYQWQVADSETGTFSDISAATSSTYTFEPTTGKWYRCVVDGTASKAVMAVYPGQDGRTWTKPYSSWYISNGTMAYMVYNTIFDAVGLYTKNSVDYMLCTSYGRCWNMFSSDSETPTAGTTTAASLDALRVSFSETDDYAVIFEADLADGQQAFSFGCDTQLGNDNTSGSYSDRAALKATVENGVLQQVAMIGAGTVAGAADTDPAFVIAPVDPASRFWIGNYSSRQTYAYNTSTGTAKETIDGQNVVTLLEGSDSGMTMSWLNVPSGGSVRFQFSVGDVAHTGAVSGKVDYAKEVLTGLEAGTTYVITAGGTTYTITANSSGEIPLSGTDTNETSYDLTGQTLTIAKQDSSDAPAQIEVAGRPTAPDTPSTLPGEEITTPGGVPEDIEVVEVTATSVTIAPIAGQEYFYSTNGTDWIRVEGTQINNLSGTSVQIKSRIAATASAPASAYSAPVTVTLQPMIEDLTGYSASGYAGAYDGAAHSITVTAPAGAAIAYSETSGTNYAADNPTYTNAGEYTVYYRVTMDGCYPAYGSATVSISKKPVTAVLTVAEKTYDGTAEAAVTAAVNSADLISGDSISITGLTGTFADANAGESKTVTVNSSGKSITGTGAGNYDVTIPASATGKINPKPITVTADAQTKTYGDAEPVLTYTVNDGGLVGSDTLTGALTRADGENVGTYAIGQGTLANSNYVITFVGANLEITKKVITPAVTMADYAYGNTPSTPVVSGNESGGTETVYYSTYSDIAANPAHRLEWKDITGTTLKAGTYYMAAHVAATDNYTEGTSAVITFKVIPAPKSAPTAPTVSGFTVTIDEADREKKLEYSLDGTNWVAVPTLNSSGSFDLTGLKAGTNYTVYLRQKASADGNYAASDPVSASFTTPTQYSVAYNANYGTGTVPSSVTRNSGSSVTVASGSGLRRTGYTFGGWNTKADGSGTAYAAGATISNGATLYAQWTANTYTVKFNANGGAGAMADQSLTYDAAAAALSTNSFTKDGYHFAGWATGASGAVVYSDKQSVKNLASGGSVTLYAVWTQNRYGISGTITSASNADVTVKLMRGNTQIGESQTVSMSGSDAPHTGTYGFSDIPAGTYNIVATQEVSGKTRTVTALVVVTNSDQTENITMPSGDTNSVLDVREDTRPVVVGGLDAEAETKAEVSKSVTVTMTVEKQEEQQLPDTASQAEQQTQEAIAEIKAEAPGKTLEFMDIAVEKKVQESGQPDITEKLAVTNTVMEIVIPYDMAGKNNITVYRHHDGVAEAFAENTTKADGTFYLDRENNLIYVYAQKFSTYAIGYTVPSTGGSVSYYPITGADTANGRLTISHKNAASGTVITITVSPDEGYELGKLIAVTGNGKAVTLTDKGDGTYSFTMPAAAVTVSASFVKVTTLPFTDIGPDHVYRSYIEYVYKHSIMNGRTDTYFDAVSPFTRAHLAVTLYRMAGSPDISNEILGYPFSDVNAESYSANAIYWARLNGIMEGYDDGTFRPNAPMTRQALVTVLYRYASGLGLDVSVSGDRLAAFPDSGKVALKMVDAVNWAVENGFVGGNTAGLLNPTGSATRGAAAKILAGFHKRYLA